MRSVQYCQRGYLSTIKKGRGNEGDMNRVWGTRTRTRTHCEWRRRAIVNLGRWTMDHGSWIMCGLRCDGWMQTLMNAPRWKGKKGKGGRRGPLWLIGRSCSQDSTPESKWPACLGLLAAGRPTDRTAWPARPAVAVAFGFFRN